MGEFDINIVKNPEIFEQNRLAAHSDHVCYKNIKEKIHQLIELEEMHLINLKK